MLLDQVEMTSSVVVTVVRASRRRWVREEVILLLVCPLEISGMSRMGVCSCLGGSLCTAQLAGWVASKDLVQGEESVVLP